MEQNNKIERSPKFNDIKSYYDNGFWNLKMVKNAVLKGKITEEEFELITGETFK